MPDAPRSRILAEARACLGMGGPEPWATEMGIVGALPSTSYCGLGVRAIWRRAGLEVRDWKIGGANLEGLKKTTAPLPGDLIQWRGDKGHQSLFVRLDGSIVESIDWNTTGKDKDGKDSFSTVAEKRRPIADVLAFYAAPAGPVPSPVGGSTRTGLQSSLVLGVDVSAYQDPSRMDWPLLRSLGYSFAYVRGVKMGRELDVHAVEHVTRASAAGFRVGLYLFFDPRHPVEQQVRLAHDAHGACGMHPGDLAPALDVESIGGGPQACREWVGPVREILEALTDTYRAAMRYHNVADWFAMGKPSELERWPLWLADYTPPADLPCVCWQQRSAPITGYGSTKLDQNAAMGDLPTIGPRDDVLSMVEPSTLPEEIAIPWVSWDRAEHDRLRNAAVARHTAREPL